MNRSYGLGLSIGIGTVSYTVLSQIKDTNNIIDNECLKQGKLLTIKIA